MKTHSSRPRHAGFTLVELLVGTVVGALVALGVFAFINTGSLLAARNLSVNLTSNSMRGALDRIEHLIEQSNNTPVLMAASGAAVAGNGPAAGVRFDLFKGGPVLISPAGSNPPATSLSSGATGMSIRYAQASSRDPAGSDIVIFDGGSNVRPRLNWPPTSTSAPSVGMRQYVMNLAAPLASGVTATTALRARLVRDVALVVVTAGANRELRYYTDMATTTNMSDASKYTVLTDQIATETAADATPFSLTTISTRTFVAVSLRVRASNFDRRLLGKQADQFNTFAQVNSVIRPKVNP
jgi:prepilin-type N-terminal cleavage/methylation domain-containing protein